MPRALERQPGPWGQNRAEVSVAWPPLARSLGSADAGAGTDSAARSYFWSAEAEIRAQENSFWIIKRDGYGSDAESPPTSHMWVVTTRQGFRADSWSGGAWRTRRSLGRGLEGCVSLPARSLSALWLYAEG